MKIKRVAALDMLAGLRGLDGIQTSAGPIAFEFKPDVIDKIVENILELKAVAVKVEAYRDELKKQLGSGRIATPAAQAMAADIDEQFTRWLLGEEEVNLQPITKAELNLVTNRIPVGIREKIAPIVQA